MKIPGEIPKVLGVNNKISGVRRYENLSGVKTGKDAISISSQAKDFQEVLMALKKAPDVRADKVDELSRRLESGNYRVDSGEIAEKIIRSVIDFKV